MPAHRLPHRAIRTALTVVAWFTLVAALVGMFGLTLADGMGLPASWLDATMFSSWVVPGILLGVLVGGSQALALVARARRLRLGWALHAAAGVVVLVWIFVELAIVLAWSPLHAVFFVAGVVQVSLALLALGAWPSPLFATDPRPASSRR